MTSGSLFASLREKARAAFEVDQGPWYYDGRDIFTRDTNGAAAHHLVIPLPETWHESQRVPEAIAQHVAACDPSSVLALLVRLEVLEEERYYFLRLEAAARRLADAADRLERNPMANNLPRFRYPVVDAVGEVRSLLEDRRAGNYCLKCGREVIGWRYSPDLGPVPLIATTREPGCVCTDPSLAAHAGHELRCPLSHRGPEGTHPGRDIEQKEPGSWLISEEHTTAASGSEATHGTPTIASAGASSTETEAGGTSTTRTAPGEKDTGRSSGASSTNASDRYRRDVPDEVRRLRREIVASLIAVKGHLDQPYPDDPRWTPWTRFIEATLARVDDLARFAEEACVEASHAIGFCGRDDLDPHRPHHWARLQDGSYGDYDDPDRTMVWCPGA